MLKLLLISLLLVSCSHHKKEGDRHLAKDEAPSFLKNYVQIEDVDYFEKTKNNITTYEIKYLDHEEEVSVTFSETGNFIEEERDTKFHLLPQNIQELISDHLANFYPGAKIHEVEIRKTKSQNNLIDVEIRHSSSPTRYWEISFDKEGNFVEKKVENVKQIETLN